jgi:hypothetical protein
MPRRVGLITLDDLREMNQERPNSALVKSRERDSTVFQDRGMAMIIGLLPGPAFGTVMTRF